MGHRHAGALAYADDLTLLSPSRSGLKILVEECERYADEFDIIFNGSKSKLLFFKGRCCTPTQRGIYVSDQMVNISITETHLGHSISSVDRSKIVKSASSTFWRNFNMFLSHFRSLSSFMKSKLFSQFCCSFYGAPLWHLKSSAVQDICVDWRKALRSGF